MELTRIHQIAANVDDLAATRDFYSNVLGARYIAEYDPPGLLFFDFAGTRVLFERNSPNAVLYFWVDDIDRAHKELAGKGVAFDGEPHLIYKDEDGTFGQPGQEEWMAFFTDPGGNTLALATRR
ncbi:MAG: VOC family protein [Gammaproteobacteria bacterium]|jgi:methylmalonyl-CoA/ethylmalonyl-CoA epimerase